MKVQDLIAILEDCDPEANLYVMAQQNYPFECALYGAHAATGVHRDLR